MPGYLGSSDCEIEPITFVNCSAMECNASSSQGEYDSMTLRAGFSNCYKHLDTNEIKARIDNRSRWPNANMITVIFYHLGLGKDGQAEQLSAVSYHKDQFSSIIKTTVRANTSPTLREIAPSLYNFLAEEPKEVMKNFLRFIRRTHSMNQGGDTDMRNVVLTAHAGSCHDHVDLLRIMMSWGIKPPDFQLADSVLLFKMIHPSDEAKDAASLVSLVAKRAAWLSYKPNDVDSHARALRETVMAAFPDTAAACHIFSISCKGFMQRTGLSMHPVRNPTYTHPPVWDRATICEESGNLIRP